jgi:hypothetical protein
MAMQEGEEQPEKTRTEEFIEALGLPEQVTSALADSEKPIEEVVTTFKTGYNGLIKETYLNTWEEEKKTALIKETQTGSHMAIQNKLLKAFGLDGETFKDVDKKTEAIITAAKEMSSKQLEDLKAKLDGKTDATSKQLQEQLDLRNNEFEAAARQMEELKKFKEEFPTIKEQIILAERDRMWTSEQVTNAAEKIENKNAAASINLINLLIGQVAKIEVVRDDKGNKALSIKDIKTDAPFMRTATDNYKDLPTFIKEQILKPNRLLNLQNPQGQSNGQQGTQKVTTKTKSAIHPNAQV